MPTDETAASAQHPLLDLVDAERSALGTMGKRIKEEVSKVKGREVAHGDEDQGEEIANLMLAYRHTEDARMRLGKVIQAYHGGESIFDKPKG